MARIKDVDGPSDVSIRLPFGNCFEMVMLIVVVGTVDYFVDVQLAFRLYAEKSKLLPFAITFIVLPSVLNA